MIKRKGFTLLEAIVTISILAICFALTIGVVATLTDIQKASSSNISLDNEIDKVDKTVKEYVSLVSVNTSAKSYSLVESANDYEIIFSKSGQNYFLRYVNQHIGIYQGTNVIVEHKVENITAVKFEYITDLALLVSDVQTSINTYRFTYTVRTML